MGLTIYMVAQQLVLNYCRKLRHFESLYFASVANNILWWTFVKACFNVVWGLIGGVCWPPLDHHSLSTTPVIPCETTPPQLCGMWSQGAMHCKWISHERCPMSSAEGSAGGHLSGGTPAGQSSIWVGLGGSMRVGLARLVFS